MFSAETILLPLLTSGVLVPFIGEVIDVIEQFTSKGLNKGQKRFLALALTVLVTAGTYSLAVLGDYWPNPISSPDFMQAAVNDLVYLVALNFTTSQLLLSGFRSDTFHRSIGSKSKYVPKKEVTDESGKTDLSVLFQ